jgi:hypothetical protein
MPSNPKSDQTDADAFWAHRRGRDMAAEEMRRAALHHNAAMSYDLVPRIGAQT